MIAFFKRFINRLRFRTHVRTDESLNVIDSIAKARQLYRALSVKAHPDRNPKQREVAEDIMQRLVANKQNYAGLLLIQEEIEEKLKRN